MILFRMYLLKIIYFLCSFMPVKDKLVFASNHADHLQGNMKSIYDQLQRTDYEGSIVSLLYQSKNDFWGKVNYLLQMIKAVFHLATCKYFIVDDYYYPIYVIKPKSETTIIQVWHGCGAFKKFGYSVLDKSFGASRQFAEKVKIHSNYTYVLVSSNHVKDIYAEAFHMSREKILSIGIPRTDLFFNRREKEKTIELLYSEYPILKEKTVLLYAPTFRGNNKFEAKNDLLPDFDQMTEKLGENYIILLKLHPFVREVASLNHNDSIIDLSQWDNINELMLVSNLLITDYSSVIFEYALLERPMIFFAPDQEKYMAERDFYYDYKSFVPGKIVENTSDLIIAIQEEDHDIEKVRRFKNHYFDYQDDRSSKRFVEQLILKKD